MALDTIRLSKQGRDQLVWLKRVTGITHWNVLCRWAFCVSLAEPSRPRKDRIPADSNVEMTWKTFGGDLQEIYMALLKERCQRDGIGLTPETLSTYFRLHLHRGIGYLMGGRDIKSITDLVDKALSKAEPRDA